jgi:hypothetical protein
MRASIESEGYMDPDSTSDKTVRTPTAWSAGNNDSRIFVRRQSEADVVRSARARSQGTLG